MQNNLFKKQIKHQKSKACMHTLRVDALCQGNEAAHGALIVHHTWKSGCHMVPEMKAGHMQWKIPHPKVRHEPIESDSKWK